MAYIKNVGGKGAGGGGAPGMFQRPGSLNNAATTKPATTTNPGARVRALARSREVRAKDSLTMRSRVQALARGQEIKMGQDLAKQAVSGKAAHAGLSNTAKGARGKKFYEGQKASKVKPYTGAAGTGPKAPVVGEGGRNQVTPAGQSAFEKAAGKSMFGPNGEGMPLRQRAMFIRKNQGR